MILRDQPAPEGEAEGEEMVSVVLEMLYPREDMRRLKDFRYSRSHAVIPCHTMSYLSFLYVVGIRGHTFEILVAGRPAHHSPKEMKVVETTAA